jgi:hypothetical protein
MFVGGERKVWHARESREGNRGSQIRPYLLPSRAGCVRWSNPLSARLTYTIIPLLTRMHDTVSTQQAIQKEAKSAQPKTLF